MPVGQQDLAFWDPDLLVCPKDSVVDAIRDVLEAILRQGDQARRFNIEIGVMGLYEFVLRNRILQLFRRICSAGNNGVGVIGAKRTLNSADVAAGDSYGKRDRLRPFNELPQLVQGRRRGERAGRDKYET